MIILTIYGIIVFHLTEWICEFGKSLTKALYGYGWNMLAFSYSAIPTRHDITCKPMLGDILYTDD